MEGDFRGITMGHNVKSPLPPFAKRGYRFYEAHFHQLDHNGASCIRAICSRNSRMRSSQ